jgi:hypothetical protein
MFVLFAVFPVAVSGMITLPVTAQMYHSLVQQQIPNSDNTVCVTPMQVQNFITNSSLCSIANATGNFFMASSNNRSNLANMPLQPSVCSVKSILPNPANHSHLSNKSVTRKSSIIKKKFLNLSMTKSSKATTKSGLNNNHSNNNRENLKNKNESNKLMLQSECKNSQRKSESKILKNKKLSPSPEVLDEKRNAESILEKKN